MTIAGGSGSGGVEGLHPEILTCACRCQSPVHRGEL